MVLSIDDQKIEEKKLVFMAYIDDTTNKIFAKFYNYNRLIKEMRLRILKLKNK